LKYDEIYKQIKPGEDLFSTLPIEIVSKILSYLDMASLGRLSLSSKWFRFVLCEEGWRTLFLQKGWKRDPMNKRFESLHSYASLYRHHFTCEVNWEKAQFLENELLPTSASIRVVRFDDQKIVCAGNQKIHFCQKNSWNKFDRRRHWKISSIHSHDVTDIRLLSDGTILSCSINGGLFRSRLMEDNNNNNGTNNHQLITNYRGHNSIISSIFAHSNLLWSGGYECTVKQWNLETGECLRDIDFESKRIWSISSNSKSAVVGLGGVNDTLYLVDAETAVKSPLSGHRGAVYATQIDENGVVVTASYDGSICYFDSRTSKLPTRTLHDLDDIALYSMQYDNNWKIVAGTAIHGLVRVWDLRMGGCLFSHFTAGLSVFSLQFDEEKLLIANNALVALDFSLNISNWK
jgi:WD40 repeat protein